jgi:predicted O-methyltransferase YrrM
MLEQVKRLAKKLKNHLAWDVPVKWIKRETHSRLQAEFNGNTVKPKRTTYSSKIESLAKQTNELGPQPLWKGYGKNNSAGANRTPDTVRTGEAIGNLYTNLVQSLQPNIVVEFGTAFGVSGMYFLAGIELNKKGKLLTFEPNDIWREIAIQNLSKIGAKFDSIAGTFEDHIEKSLPNGQSIDMAFIDAIHTKEFVIPQLDIVVEKSNDRAIIILDDIDFSDSMKECWEEVSLDNRFLCSAELGGRVGILELKKFN